MKPSPEQQVTIDAIEEFLIATHEGEIAEIRALHLPNNDTGRILSSDLHRLARTAWFFNEKGGDVYHLLNPVAAHSSYATSCITAAPDRNPYRCATDGDILERRKLLLDFDANRPTGTAATNEQVALAEARANKFVEHVQPYGWGEPIRLMSGNGVQLLFQAAIPPRSTCWRDALRSLSAEFSDELVKLDPVVHNIARVARMPHTINRKSGRTATVVYPSTPLVTIIEEMVLKLEFGDPTYVPVIKPAAAPSARAWLPALDVNGVFQLVEEFPEVLSIHEMEERGDQTFFHLAECPFVGRMHRGTPGSSAIAVGADSLNFLCFSDECQGKTMGDLRRLLISQTGREPSMPFFVENPDAFDLEALSARWGGIEWANDGTDHPTPEPPKPTAKRMHLDFETRSELDIKEVGLDRYASDPSTRALLVAYAFDDGPVEVADLSAEETLPAPVLDYLLRGDGDVLAWNIAFETAILKYRFKVELPISRQADPMPLARFATLPGSLAGASAALKLELAKNEDGKRLIRLFSSPSKALKAEIEAGRPARFFRDRVSNPEDWALFIEYCRRDVEACRAALARMTAKFDAPGDFERAVWELDQVINERGLPIDIEYVTSARALMQDADEATLASIAELTGVANPNSAAQLKTWLSDQSFPMESLDEEHVTRALSMEPPPQVESVLRLRAKQSGAGPKKLNAIVAQMSGDGRLRHQLQYYGGRTGRWSGRGVQPHNLPRPTPALADYIEQITEMIRSEQSLPADMDIADAVTSTIRSAIRAKRGHQLLISDYSSIESRLLAWLSGCQPLLNVYREGRDAYKAFASAISGKAYDEITKPERTAAKPAVLGCGYGMSGPRLAAYAESMGIVMDLTTAHEHVNVFRTTYAEIPELWNRFDECAKIAILDRTTTSPCSGVELSYDPARGNYLRMQLPSGRPLYYLFPRVEMVDKGWGLRPNVTYAAAQGVTLSRRSIFGAMFVENAIQAIARDILADALLRADAAGFNLICHIHDEIICEEAIGNGRTSESLVELMSITPAWGLDIPLAAEGHSSTAYTK